MRLADARWSDEAQPFGDRWKLIGKLLRLFHRRDQLFIRIGREGLEIAAPVPRRNPRFVHQPRREPAAPAVATLDASRTIQLDRFPTGVIAEIAGHWRGVDCKTPANDPQRPSA